MQLISEEYCRLNEQLHQDNKEYGTSGYKHAHEIYAISQRMNTTDILDYGCGKSKLAANLPFAIKEYDPAIPKHAALPGPANIVVCTDVLEHIEPELIDNVLAHIQMLTKHLFWCNIATRPAKKVLADGRNAHLLIRNGRWWLTNMLSYFDIVNFEDNGDSCTIVCTPKKGV